MYEEGYIKTLYALLDWEWYDNPATFKVFMHFLLTARWKDGSWHGIELKRGELLESIVSISERNGLSIREVRTAISHLIDTKSVTVRSVGKYHIYKVLKYDYYQNRHDFRQDSDTVATQYRHDSDTVATLHKERNKGNTERKDRRIEKDIYGEYKHVQLTADEYQRLIQDFGQDLTDRAIRVVDEYVESSGKKYKNYNLTIRKWGIESARKEEEKSAGSTSRRAVSVEQYYRDKYPEVFSNGDKDQTVHNAG